MGCGIIEDGAAEAFADEHVAELTAFVDGSRHQERST